jgi:hypothetical protein
MKLKVEGGAGNTTRVHSPMDTVEVIVRDPEHDGVGTSSRSNSLRSLCYYDLPPTDSGFDAPAALRAADLGLARSAVLTAWTHERFIFELVDLAGDGTDIRGRLVRIEDASRVPLVTLTYRHARDAAALAPDRLGREALWMLRQVSGGGETLRFDYTTDLVGGAYAIRRITLPGGRVIRYQYGLPADDLTPDVDGDLLPAVDTNWGTDGDDLTSVPSSVPVFGLRRIIHPTGERSTFSTHLDWDSRCHVVRFVDLRDIHGRADQEVYLNLSVWWPADADPTTSAADEFAAARAVAAPLPGLVRQADNLVRIVIDRTPAVPQCTFFAWHGTNQNGHQAVFHYLRDDARFGGPRLAQYAYNGDYAYYTQYATDTGWWGWDYDDRPMILPVPSMVWGSKETCNYNYGFVNWTFAGDLGRNGQVKRDATTGLMLNGTLPHTPPVWR